jgi:transposase
MPLLPKNGHRGKQWRDQRWRWHTRPGRPRHFDAALYRCRNVAERCVNKPKQWRAVATRYEKRATSYSTVVVVASILIWLGM